MVEDKVVQQTLFHIPTDAKVMNELRSLPKLDLHRHITGSIDAETAVKIAAKYNVELPTYVASELHDLIYGPGKVSTLRQYFEPWDILNRLFVSPEAVRDIIMEIARRGVVEDNVIYAELRTSPRGFLGHSSFGFEEFLKAASISAEESERTYGVIIRYILGIPRHVFGKIPSRNRNKMFARLLDMIEPFYPRYFVGVDLNGEEEGTKDERFQVFFRMASDRGFNITVHAGEVGPASHIWYAVDQLRAQRIGHGLRAVEDVRLLRTLAERNCALEICPSSNKLLGLVSGIEALPLKSFQEYGVPFVICTDNPARCRTSLSTELFKITKSFGLSLSEIKEIAFSSLKYSFADAQTKKTLRSRIEEYCRLRDSFH